MSNSEKKNTFFGGAAILAIGAIVVKLIGALYKIPLANILGDENNGYFNAAYSIYSVLLTISTGGLPVALSKQVSEAHALGHYNQKQKVFSVALRTFFVMGVVCFLIMFLGARSITANILRVPGAYCATLVMAPSVLFVCCMSALRGYTQGQGIMTPTAISQILEALCKLVLGLSLAYVMLNWGSKLTEDFTPGELSAAGAIAGVTLGTLFSLIYLSFDHMKLRQFQKRKHSNDKPESSRVILLRLIQLGVPITLGASIVPIVNMLDNGIVAGRLQEVFNMSETDAAGMWGMYSAVVNLYNLPSALMVPFTASLIPAISSARARRNYREVGKLTESAMRVSMLLACPMGFGLSSLALPIVTMLYDENKYDHAAMGPLLTVLGIASIFTCIVVLSNSILQANGLVNLPIATMIIGSVLKLVLTYVLVSISGIQIQGAAIGTFACFACVGLLDLAIIHRALPSAPSYGRVFVKPLLSSAIMAVAAWAVHGLLFAIFHRNTIAVLGAIIIAVIVYGILVLVLQAISKDDLALMPKGDKIAKLLRIS